MGTAVDSCNSGASSREISVIWLILLAYLAVGYLTLTPGHEWGDDWAQYVNHARNIATGHPYTDTGYVFNPGNPHVGPPGYAPGYPLMLAPAVNLFGLNLIALKTLSLFCMAGAALCVFFLVRQSLGITAASVAALMFALHDLAWLLRDSLVSEPAYLLWSFASLALASRPFGTRGLLTGILCSALGYAAFAVRPVGITVVSALLLNEICKGRLGTVRFLAMALVAASAIIAQKTLLVLADYSAEIHPPNVHLVLANLGGYWQQAAWLFPLPAKLSILSPLPIISLALSGVWLRVRNDSHRVTPTPTASALRRVLGLIPVEVWYVALYLGALLSLPFEPQERYLLPILPILLAYATYSLLAFMRARQLPRYAAVALVVCVAVYYGALHYTHDRINRGQGALCSDCRQLYSFVAEKTPPNALAAFVKPRVLALETGRRGWAWTPGQGRDANWRELLQAHVNYLIIVRPTHELANYYPDYLSWDGWRANKDLTLVFENDTFRVLRLNR